MRRKTFHLGAVAAVVAACVIPLSSSSAGQTGLQRQVLLQKDLAIPGYEVVVVAVTIAVDGREGKHWHYGTLVGYVLEGELTLEQEGQPTKTIEAGESIIVEPHQVHEGINRGRVPIKALVTFITEKGKPLTTPAI